jgi:hypothetical protein
MVGRGLLVVMMMVARARSRPVKVFVDKNSVGLSAPDQSDGPMTSNLTIVSSTCAGRVQRVVSKILAETLGAGRDR